MSKNFLLVEKYASTNVEECILPKSIKKVFLDIEKSGKVPNMILAGPPGVGKTNLCKALANSLDRDFMIINGSDERSIDVIRNKVKSYASTLSLSNTGKKILLIDEGDNLTNDSQLALRAVIEELQHNCSFIFTCNYKNRIDPAIQSRCPVVDFTIPSKEKPELAKQFYNKILYILDKENIKYENPNLLSKLLIKYFPDFRRTLNVLQKYSTSGTIDSSILAQATDININSLYEYLKERNFTEVRKWVINNLDNDPNTILRKFYDGVDTVMVKHSIPQAILIIHDHMSKNVVDNEVNLIACFIKIMIECEWI
jgi:DNA polymerase III delta prime subunit